MKALILKGTNEPFIYENVPDPIPQNGEAVAKILACGSGLTIQHVKAGRTKVKFPILIIKDQYKKQLNQYLHLIMILF